MVATPADEIAKQHEEAIRLVTKEQLPCAPSINHGEIPLRWKRHPTQDDPTGFRRETDTTYNCTSSDAEEKKADESWNGCVSSRGFVDITPLADLCREAYNSVPPVPRPKKQQESKTNTNKPSTKNNNRNTKAKKQQQEHPVVRSKTNLWDEVNAQVHNVHVIRPSHDAWGIQKIVLMFCDDFLQQVYEMPWWHERSDIRDAVQPILDILSVSPERVVRLLLASLPPGVTIPIHHDTGAWVQQTHRVHVPVIVPDVSRILFRCGPTPDTMERIDCTPGHVFEINNQAKHAVSNCSTDYFRVHLILDYMDEKSSCPAMIAVPRRTRLEPGEQLLQTRRSIDRVVDYGKRPTPSFLILGVQKAGTTSLYDYMTQHPLIIKAKRRETHCLDWRWNDSLNSTEQRRDHCQQFYYTQELKSHPSCLTGDSTPSYLLDSVRVISRLQEVFPWCHKFIVMLRDPVLRAQSHYAMVTSLDGTPAQIKTRGIEWRNMSFEDVVMQDMQNLKKHGLIPYWNVERGLLNQEVFDAFVGSNKEDESWKRYLHDDSVVPLHTGSHCLVSRGLYELQLRPWFRAFAAKEFLVLRLEDMATASEEEGGHTTSSGVQRTLERVWKHLDLPAYVVKDESAKNTRSYETIMTPEMRKYLERFYEPHNRRLKKLLGGAEWSNPWKYSEKE